ncbi:MAG: Txe/YoeB family addiction module toxin [Pseudorhodoplanes sp.]
MKLAWASEAWADYERWRDVDSKVHDRINALIENIAVSPFKGIGKPEPLKYDLSGWWSRRITGEHRLIYRVTGQGKDRRLEILSCRYHY